MQLPFYVWSPDTAKLCSRVGSHSVCTCLEMTRGEREKAELWSSSSKLEVLEEKYFLTLMQIIFMQTKRIYIHSLLELFHCTEKSKLGRHFRKYLNGSPATLFFQNIKPACTFILHLFPFIIHCLAIVHMFSPDRSFPFPWQESCLWPQGYKSSLCVIPGILFDLVVKNRLLKCVAKAN